jgi:hypothetical protein
MLGSSYIDSYAPAAIAAFGPRNARISIRVLRAQRGDYLPASIQSVPLAAGGTGLRIQFAAPSPLGLLRPLTSQP